MRVQWHVRAVNGNGQYGINDITYFKRKRKTVSSDSLREGKVDEEKEGEEAWRTAAQAENS